MSDIIDLNQWKARKGSWNLLHIDSCGAGRDIVCAFRMHELDGETRVGVTFPNQGDGAQYDGFALSPAAARSLGMALIECASDIEGVAWLSKD